jgi:hypothetical protein
MSKLIRLSRRHRTEATLPPADASGDWDLVPVAIILWLGSVARVAFGALGGEAFRAEATLALYVVVLIPCWLLWLLVSSNDRGTPRGPAAARDVPNQARVIEFPARRPPRETA